MVGIMLDSLKENKEKVKGSWSTQTEGFMKAIGKMIREKVKDMRFTQTATFTLDLLVKERQMEKVFILGNRVRSMMENGLQV